MNRGVKLFVGFIVLSLFLLTIVSAVTTPITIKTFPEHNLTIRIISPANYAILADLSAYSGTDGLVTVNPDTTQTTISVYILARKDGKITSYDTYGNYTAGNSININMLQAVEETAAVSTLNVSNVTEAVENNSVSLSNVSEENASVASSGAKPSTTGDAISDSVKGWNFGIPSWVYYGLGVILFLGVLGFVGLKTMLRIRNPQKIVTRKMSDMNARESNEQYSEKRDFNEGKSSLGNSNDRIRAAERKLAKAQQDLAKLKNEGKIKEAERKLREDQEALERLRGSLDN